MSMPSFIALLSLTVGAPYALPCLVWWGWVGVGGGGGEGGSRIHLFPSLPCHLQPQLIYKCVLVEVQGMYLN